MASFHAREAVPFGPRWGSGKRRWLIAGVLLALLLALGTPQALRYRREQLNHRLADILGESDDPREVQLQLRQGADLRTRASDGLTVLHFAAAHGEPAFVSAVLDRGFPIDTVSGSGRTPLMEACLMGRLDNARLLMARGANPRATSATQSPLDCAVLSGNVQLILELVSRGVDPNQTLRDDTLLTTAARINRPEVVDALLRVGVPIDRRDGRGMTALMEAAMLGRWQVVETLLQHRASRTLKDSHGRDAAAITRASRPGYLRYLRGLGLSQAELRQADQAFQSTQELLQGHHSAGHS